MSTAPAARNLVTTVASYGGRYPARIFDEAVVSTPRVHMLSLSAIGIPWRVPSNPRRPLGVGGPGRIACSLGVERQIGMNLGLGHRRPFEHRLGEVHCRELPCADGRTSLCDRQVGGRGHVPSRAGGTTKYPSLDAGA